MGKHVRAALALAAAVMLAVLPSLSSAAPARDVEAEATATACIGLADAALESQRYDEASRLYERALLLEPASTAARLGSAKTARAMRRDPYWPPQ